MSKPAAPRRVADNEALAVNTMIRGSDRKLNLVAGLIRGKKRCSYHCDPLRAMPMRRVRKPATSGIPRKIRTLLVMDQVENCASAVCHPSHPGRICR